MISDAYIDATCDKCLCDETMKLPVVYSSLAGRDPHCDLRDSALEDSLRSNGWRVSDGKHYCPDCKAEVTND